MPQLVCERSRQGQSEWVLTGTSLKPNLLKFGGGEQAHISAMYITLFVCPHVLYVHTWLDVKEEKLLSADAFVLTVELFIRA